MITATKKKRGGEDARDTESIYAVTLKTTNGRAIRVAKPDNGVPGRSKSKVGDNTGVTDVTCADLTSGDRPSATESFRSAGETKGANPSDTDHDGALNGRATPETKPIPRMRGRSNKLGKGECESETEAGSARPAETNGRAVAEATPTTELHDQPEGGEDLSVTDIWCAIFRQLTPLQRARYTAIRMRVRVDNGVGSYIASQLGDGADKSEADRQRIRKVADELVACVWKSKPLKHPEHEAIIAANLGMIEAAGIASKSFQSLIDRLSKEMESLVKQLPIAEWLELPEQRGIGLVSVAAIIGECGTDKGNLPDYRNPSCVWKRMGCAPYQGKMPSTWRSGKEGKASAEDWVAMGYCPRRRALMYVIGEGIVKQNGDGPYRKRYDEAKVTFAEKHPDYSKGRCHSHAMLLASKLLLKNLWVQMRLPS